MTYNPDIHHRRSIRLRGHDYSIAGSYFVTICAWQRQCLFGDIVDGTMILNNYGILAEGCWKAIPSQYEQVVTDAFVIMPNHVHGIISIVGARFIASGQSPNSVMAGYQTNQGAINRAPTVGEMIRGFKARCSCLINKKRENQGCPVWQRNYYERVIRNDNELNHAREYIINNPLKWNDDDYNPAM